MAICLRGRREVERGNFKSLDEERWDGGYGEWFVVVNRFKTKVSTMNVSLQLDTAGGTGVISSLVARVAVA